MTVFICPSVLLVYDASYAQDNYPTASDNHGYDLCSRHGQENSNGIFASSWLFDDTTGAVYMTQMRPQKVTHRSSNTIIFSEFSTGLNYGRLISCKNLMERSRSDSAVNYGNIGFSTRNDATPDSRNITYSTTSFGTLGSADVEGVHSIFMDGAVRFISNNIDGS